MLTVSLPLSSEIANEGVEIVEQRSSPERHFDGRVGVAGEQRFVKKTADKFFRRAILPGHASQDRSERDEHRRFVADSILTATGNRFLDDD